MQSQGRQHIAGCRMVAFGLIFAGGILPEALQRFRTDITMDIFYLISTAKVRSQKRFKRFKVLLVKMLFGLEFRHSALFTQPGHYFPNKFFRYFPVCHFV